MKRILLLMIFISLSPVLWGSDIKNSHWEKKFNEICNKHRCVSNKCRLEMRMKACVQGIDRPCQELAQQIQKSISYCLDCRFNQSHKDASTASH